MKHGHLGKKGLIADCCRICGSAEKLSRTHIPPRAAGNQGRTRRGLELIDSEGTSWLTLSRLDGGGGIRGRWLCATCNGKIGRWDEEYAKWSVSLVLKMHDHGVVTPVDGKLAMRANDGDPGAVVRSMWAWMFSLDPELREREPELGKSLLTGDPAEPPSGRKLLLGATTSLRIWVVSHPGGVGVRQSIGRDQGHRSPSGIWIPGPEIVDAPRVAVTSPPFVALLAEDDHAAGADYFDTGPWLAERPGGRREVSLLLPVARDFDAGGTPNLLTYEELAS